MAAIGRRRCRGDFSRARGRQPIAVTQPTTIAAVNGRSGHWVRDGHCASQWSGGNKIRRPCDASLGNCRPSQRLRVAAHVRLSKDPRRKGIRLARRVSRIRSVQSQAGQRSAVRGHGVEYGPALSRFDIRGPWPNRHRHGPAVRLATAGFRESGIATSAHEVEATMKRIINDAVGGP